MSCVYKHVKQKLILSHTTCTCGYEALATWSNRNIKSKIIKPHPQLAMGYVTRNTLAWCIALTGLFNSTLKQESPAIYQK